MVVSILLKTKFGHIQISVPKIGIPMSKTVCIKPSALWLPMYLEYINLLLLNHLLSLLGNK